MTISDDFQIVATRSNANWIMARAVLAASGWAWRALAVRRGALWLTLSFALGDRDSVRLSSRPWQNPRSLSQKEGIMFRHAALVLAAVGAMSFASPAVADHCKGQHKNDPGCDGPGNGGTTPGPLVVRDGTGAVVGPLLNTNGAIATFDFVYVIVQTDVDGTPRTFVVEVTPTDFQSVSRQNNGSSEGTLCEEPLFVRAETLLGLEFAFVYKGLAYIADPAEVPETLNRVSYRAANGDCIINADVQKNVVATVSVDLDLLFVPPFSLGF